MNVRSLASGAGSAALAPGGFDDDAPLPAPDNAPSFERALASAVDDLTTGLREAERAERAFAQGRGGLQEMVVARAEADVRLSLAVATATRATQALSTVLGMQL